MYLADKCKVVGCFVCGDYDKIIMETGKFSDNIRVTEMDSCLVLTECFSRRILRLRTLAIDLIHSERVSTSTSSFLFHRLVYSSHASMIMPKFWWYEYETCSLYFGPLLKKSLSFLLLLRTIPFLKKNGMVSFIRNTTVTLYKELVCSGVGLNFDPIEFRPVGSWFNGLCSGFNGFFM